MLSTKRLSMNQSLYTGINGQPYKATRHTYESVKAIFDITILELNGYTIYSKNCKPFADKYNDIPEDDKQYYDFITEEIMRLERE